MRKVHFVGDIPLLLSAVLTSYAGALSHLNLSQNECYLFYRECY